ncbi:hypothetical protein V8C34DRAFT_273623 [Trichoderma compactum]
MPSSVPSARTSLYGDSLFFSLSFALSLPKSSPSPRNLILPLLSANVTLHRLHLAYSYPILINIHMHIQYAVARKKANERKHHVVKPYNIYTLANMSINSIHYAIYAVLCKMGCRLHVRRVGSKEE